MTTNDRRARLEVLNDCLSEYLAIEKRVLGQRLFETVPYTDLRTALASTVAETRAIADAWPRDTGNEGVARYIADLLVAMDALGTIIDGLGRKATNTGRYGWFAFRRDRKAYRRAVDAYVRNAGAVNAAYADAGADASAADAAEIAAMIRVIAFHETRELATRWGTSVEDLGLAVFLAEYAGFLFRVTDILAFGTYGDPRRDALMRDVGRALYGQMVGALGDSPETRRTLVAILDDEVGTYASCRSVAGERSVIAAAAARFVSRYGRGTPEDTVEALTMAIVGMTGTPPFAPLAPAARHSA